MKPIKTLENLGKTIYIDTKIEVKSGLPKKFKIKGLNGKRIN